MAEISLNEEKTFVIVVLSQVSVISVDFSAISQGILLQYGSFGSLNCNQFYKLKSIESIERTIID